MAAQTAAPQRGSTRSVYEAMWTIFVKWCITHQVDFGAPPVKSVADFLMYLFWTGRCSPAPVMVTVQPLLINGEIRPSISATMKIPLISWIVSTGQTQRPEGNPLTTFVTTFGSPDLDSGHTQPTMGGFGCICLPTSSHLGKSGGEAVRPPLRQNYSDHSRVAKCTLVLQSRGHVTLNSPEPAQSSNTALQTPHRNLPT